MVELMKSFRLYLGRTDRRLIFNLARLTLAFSRLTKSLTLYRFTIWLFTLAPPWGVILAATVGIEAFMIQLSKRIVVTEDGSA